MTARETLKQRLERAARDIEPDWPEHAALIRSVKPNHRGPGKIAQKRHHHERQIMRLVWRLKHESGLSDNDACEQARRQFPRYPDGKLVKLDRIWRLAIEFKEPKMTRLAQNLEDD